MTALGMPGDRIALHYTGLDRERFTPVPRTSARQLVSALPGMEIPPDGHLLLSVGALVPVKGIDLALDALALLPTNTRLAIAGTGPLETALRRQTERLGLTGRVHFLGAVGHEALPALLSAADVMVLPSEREGLANAWIEALACGTPLVIPPIGGACEVVTSRDAGRLAERTPEAIAAAVRDILVNPPTQQAVAASAARFSWEACAAQMAGIYAAIAG